MDAKQKRSKAGCNTCRQRKVKCSETRPECQPCQRLRLTCKWVDTNAQSLRSKRRGIGPLKSRDTSWKPAVIAPILRNSAAADFLGTSASQYSNSRDGISYDPPPASFVLLEETEGSFNDLPSSFGFSYHPENSSIGMYSFDGCLLDADLSPGSEPATGLPSEYNDFALSKTLGLTATQIALPNALILDPREHEALRHYQTKYSLYRTTKDPVWSTHKVLLDIGAQDSMIMHLLLAVSLNDYSSRVSDIALSQVAAAHFRNGANMVIEASTLGTNTLNMMAAYFFVYLYMSKRESAMPDRLNKLSLTILQFVEENQLVDECIRVESKTVGVLEHNTARDKNRSLLARLIMWTLDEDVKSNFQGAGGHFARHLAKQAGTTKHIYDVSRNALGDYWGTTYPHEQALDDDQNATVLEFLWVLMALWQDINDLCLANAASSQYARIEQRFAILQQQYSSVFRHAMELTQPRPRILVNADYDVILFQALKIYWFRCTVSSLTIATPAEIENCIKSILTIVQRTFSGRSTELHDRLQWPLFLAGIESSDSIYREWIFSRITSDRVAKALRDILDAQIIAGGRLSMLEVRSLLRQPSEEDAIATGDPQLLIPPQI